MKYSTILGHDEKIDEWLKEQWSEFDRERFGADKGWKAIEFYESLGYKISRELPNHWLKEDWVELTKFF